ncbi:MAG: type II secretion system F family protein [Nitriliruptor sp.]|uniref:type II secretion system F family protein n=1 Tax=Nitriliruptor sp. TaxID=2448056 RepID=UPI0034A06762
MSRDRPATPAHGRSVAPGLEELRLRVAAGADPGDLTHLGARAETAVRVASEAGAPLLAAIDAAVAAEEDLRRSARAIEVASAQGRAVAAGLLIAPLLLVPVMGRLFGVDLLAYHRTSLGVATGSLALLLLAVGAVLARRAVATVGRPERPASPRHRAIVAVLAGGSLAVLVHPIVGIVVGIVLVKRARPSVPPADPCLAEATELVATAVSGGGSSAAALRLAADELPSLARPLRRLAFDLEHDHPSGPHPPGVGRLADVLTTAAAVGAPVGPALRRLAADVRADELARVLAASERLPVRLTFPTALCLLPGTLLLIGAPIVSAGLGAVGTSP